MDAIASQITSPTTVYSTVYSDPDQRKHQSSASLASNAKNVSIWWRHHDRKMWGSVKATAVVVWTTSIHLGYDYACMPGYTSILETNFPWCRLKYIHYDSVPMFLLLSNLNWSGEKDRWDEIIIFIPFWKGLIEAGDIQHSKSERFITCLLPRTWR